MALSNAERVKRGFEALVEGLAPFAERELRAKLGPGWRDDLASGSLVAPGKGGAVHWTLASLLAALESKWAAAFAYTLGDVGHSHVTELLAVIKRLEQSKSFGSEDAYRALDTAHRLLESISASEQAERVAALREELQRTVFAEQARTRNRQTLLVDGAPQAGLKPWRDVVTPHRDVATGRYVQAEFAADLAQVIRGEGSDEYRDPVEFFRRTHITSGLEELLVGALVRLTSGGSDPVVELQTNFGGGKTHSMLALFHLMSGADPTRLEGLETVLHKAGVKEMPKANRAVLVGTALSPAQPNRKREGIAVRTLWGELAWQLGEAADKRGPEGYAFVAESDAKGMSPGSDDLAALFTRFSPCLILIDEWVAYARMLVNERGLPAGSFEAQQSFAQSLTEAAKRAPRTLIVASIPQSQMEIGGEYGERALQSLRNVFDRVARPWRPATPQEGFEIVRRRLFERVEGREKFIDRDNVVSAFAKLYRDDPEAFPAGTGAGPYKDELTNAYPIHPELFHRLYGDWSTLDKFQRTRGVLRLLAKVIHRLWVDQDRSLLILPASIPIDDAAARSEMTRYLDDVWEPILGTDVDGPASLPLELDKSTPTLGRYSATRRVARTLFLGTAPDAGTDRKTPGIGEQHMRLGCVQPGETVGAFDDALRRYTQRARYVHQDGNRYWLSTRPNLNRTAEDRTQALLREPEGLHDVVIARVRDRAENPSGGAERTKGRGRSKGGAAEAKDGQNGRDADFLAVHGCPAGTSEVPDEADTRLVVLGPSHPHRKGQADSPARLAAKEYLEQRGSTPRIHRNAIVFVAPDTKGLDDLLQAVARFKAWNSIVDEAERGKLDLLGSQVANAKAQRDDYDRTVNLRLDDTWVHILVPSQPSPTAPNAGPPGTIRWEEVKLPSGPDSMSQRTAKKLQGEEHFFSKFAGERLRIELDSHLWAQRDHVSVGELWEWFPRYLYLPRLRSPSVLENAVIHGATKRIAADETFAVAEAWDDQRKRYVGLRLNDGPPPMLTKQTLLVKVEVAKAHVAQAQAEQKVVVTPGVGGTGGDKETPGGTTHETGPRGRKGPSGGTPPVTPAGKRPTSFFGSAELDPDRITGRVSQIAEDIIIHLASLPGATAKVTLEIHIDVPDGIPVKVEQIVRANAKTLGLGACNLE